MAKMRVHELAKELNIKSQDILDKLKNDYNILISGCFDILAGKVIRIGHMGENSHMEKVKEVIYALGNIIKR